MKRFCKLVSLSVQGALFYRAAFLFNLFTPLLLLGGQFMLWNALYRLGGGAPIGGYSRERMYSYLILAFCIHNLLTWSSENDLSREIRSGAVVARCMRPVPFLMQSLGGMAGKMLPQALVNGTAAALLFLCLRTKLQTLSPAALPLALLSLVLGVLLRMAMTSFLSLLCFFTTNHLGLTWARTALTEFFSGALIPVSLFPGWLRSFSYCTPFPLMLQTPVSIFLGEPSPLPLPICFLLQAGWILLFILLHEWIYGKIRSNLSFAGG
ncbi:MAG: hypothetical protein HFG26_06570 [Provencibacterium sp.]|jgi:ABC-2 type transport system permease protein|nr:hypothetical protein [Provencibacterium sp.]